MSPIFKHFQLHNLVIESKLKIDSSQRKNITTKQVLYPGKYIIDMPKISMNVDLKSYPVLISPSLWHLGFGMASEWAVLTFR